jgi:hypothetical protein
MSEDAALCIICGKPVAPSEVPAAWQRLPESVRRPAHESCFEIETRRSRERQDAWSRSPRGRLTLLSLRVRFGLGLIGVGLVSLIAAGPIAIWLGIRGWHLRRAMRKTLGDSDGVVLAKCRGKTDELLVAEAFPDAWAAAHGVTVRVLDSSLTRPRSLDDAVWAHWRPNAKMPIEFGIVFVPRVGRARQWSFSLARSPSGEDVGERAAVLRAAVEVVLGGATRNSL